MTPLVDPVELLALQLTRASLVHECRLFRLDLERQRATDPLARRCRMHEKCEAELAGLSAYIAGDTRPFVAWLSDGRFVTASPDPSRGSR